MTRGVEESPPVGSPEGVVVGGLGVSVGVGIGDGVGLVTNDVERTVCSGCVTSGWPCGSTKVIAGWSEVKMVFSMGLTTTAVSASTGCAVEGEAPCAVDNSTAVPDPSKDPAAIVDAIDEVFAYLGGLVYVSFGPF